MIFEESILLADPFVEVLAKVKRALQDEGFGILTEIDLQAVLADKIGKNIERYRIIGACNPVIASRALDADPQIGVLLPCNVVVRETDSGVLVEAMDPGVMSQLVTNNALEPIVSDARELMDKALGHLVPSS